MDYSEVSKYHLLFIYAYKIEILFHRAVAVGAVHAGLGQGAPVAAHFFRRQGADIGFALTDQLHDEAIQALEVLSFLMDM